MNPMQTIHSRANIRTPNPVIMPIDSTESDNKYNINNINLPVIIYTCCSTTRIILTNSKTYINRNILWVSFSKIINEILLHYINSMLDIKYIVQFNAISMKHSTMHT